MAVKFLQYWNVRHERVDEFGRFFTGEFTPEINRSGLMVLTGAWHVASGEGPYFIAEGVSESLGQAEDLIMGAAFQGLRRTLLSLVTDYATKLLIPTDPAGNVPGEVEQGFKFTQHFNVNSADYYEYLDFFQNDYLRAMAGFGVELVGVWSVAVGATPYVINETRAYDLGIIGRMLESPSYWEMTLKLLRMISGYGCKALVPSGHINE